MYTKVEIDIDDVLEGMSSTDRTELAIKLAKDNLDVEDMIEMMHDCGYEDVDILNCLDWDEIKRYVFSND